MSKFWDLDHPAGRAALIDEATASTVTYGELSRASNSLGEVLPDRGAKALGFLYGWNRPGTIMAYLAAFRRGHAVYLGNPQLDMTLRQHLVDLYRPDWIVCPSGDPDAPFYRRVPSPLEPWGLSLQLRDDAEATEPIFPEVGLLLSTSGTTGSPKLVRLTRDNVQANADSIRDYLGISEDDRPVTSLAFHYSYGLSVINSHLLAGATILLTDHSVVDREFWSLLSSERATSFAGVPFTYATLHRLRFDPARYPSLRTLTQAGGRLDVPLQDHFEKVSRAAGVRFFVMYGQTEATARISYVPPERLARKLGSIGISIPGGELAVDAESGEIVYRGPNVMLGYATTRADLAKGDENRGLLRTGDLGRKDEDGFFFVTGRLKRFIKLYGHRVNLDELEAGLFSVLGEPVACHGVDDSLLVLFENPAHQRQAEELLVSRYAVNPNAFRVISGQKIPRTDTGKVDYPRILASYLSP